MAIRAYFKPKNEASLPQFSEAAVMEETSHNLYVLDFAISGYCANKIKLPIRFTSHYKSKAWIVFCCTYFCTEEERRLCHRGCCNFLIFGYPVFTQSSNALFQIKDCTYFCSHNTKEGGDRLCHRGCCLTFQSYFIFSILPCLNAIKQRILPAITNHYIIKSYFCSHSTE